jgi:hypothetical protein
MLMKDTEESSQMPTEITCTLWHIGTNIENSKEGGSIKCS